MMVGIESSFNFLYSQNTSTKYAACFMVVQNSNTQNRARMPIRYLEEKLIWSWSVENQAPWFFLSLCLVTLFTLGSKVEGDESSLGLDAPEKGQR